MPEETNQATNLTSNLSPVGYDERHNRVVCRNRVFRPGNSALSINIRGTTLNIRLSPAFAEEVGLRQGQRGQLVCDFDRQVVGILVGQLPPNCPKLQFYEGFVGFTKTIPTNCRELWSAWEGRKLHYYEPIIEDRNGGRYILFSYANIVSRPGPAPAPSGNLRPHPETPEPVQQNQVDLPVPPVRNPDQEAETSLDEVTE
jgi:hypothetical protein